MQKAVTSKGSKMKPVKIVLMSAGMIFLNFCTPPEPEYPGCTKDEQCSDGEFCVEQLCQQCRASTDCTRYQECINGACTDVQIKCEFSRQCPEGQVCKRGSCIIPQCRTDEDCSKDYECRLHRCVPGEPYVESGEDAESEQDAGADDFGDSGL